MINVSITRNEITAASHHGLERRIANLVGDRHMDNRILPEKCMWDQDIESACAEMALAKFLNGFWTGLGSVGNADAGIWESRWTFHVDRGGLIVYPRDSDNKRYVLLDGFAPDYRLIGWLWGHEAKQEKWWQEKMQYWLVPRGELRDASMVRPQLMETT